MTVGGHVTLDAKLSVSAAVTEVQVVGEGGAQVNTQTQEMSQVVDTQQIANLPSLTRNPYDFVALAGNVSGGDNSTNSGASAIDATGSGQNQTDRGVGYAINGQRESGTEILLDGVENVSIFGAGIGEDIPLDATQEFSVITSNYSAAVWPRLRRRHQRDHQSGHQQLSRIGLGVQSPFRIYGEHLCQRRSQCGLHPGRRHRAICPSRRAHTPATNLDTQPAVRS